MAGLRPGHPRLSCCHAVKTWMSGTSPGMTRFYWLHFESDSQDDKLESVASVQHYPALGRLKHRRNRGLGLLLDLSQMLLADKTFRVDLVDILGSGRPCGKPSVFRHHLDAAERLIVARSGIQCRADRLAGKLLHGELLRRQRLQQILLRDRRGRVDPLIEWHAQFIGETSEQLTGVLFGPRGDLGGQ